MILLFTDTLGDVNGVSRFVASLAAEADRQHLPLTVVASTRRRVPSSSNIRNLPARWRVALPRYPELEVAVPPLSAIERLADAVRPTAVHISTPGPLGWAGRRLALRRSIRLVGTYHTNFPAYVHHLVERAAEEGALAATASSIMSWFYQPFDRVLARSNASVSAIRTIGIERARISVIPACVDARQFSPAHRPADLAGFWSRLGAHPHAVKILYVGRLSTEKNLPFLTRAIGSLQGMRSPTSWQLILVGDGPYRDDLSKRLLALGLDPPACFLGYRFGDDLAAAYAASDIFILPSKTETLGQVVLEAQASKLACIVANQGGPPDHIRHAVSGVVVDSDDPRAWAHAMYKLIESPTRRAALGAAAADHTRGMTPEATAGAFVRLHALSI